METIAAGIIGASHGLKGYIRFTSYSGDVDHIAEIGTVFLWQGERFRKLQVEDVRVSGKHHIIKFKEINSLEEAKNLTHWEMWIARSDALPNEEDQYYYADIYGLTVHVKGEEKGTVTGIYDTKPVDLFEVKKKSGETSIIPFSKQYIGEVDLKEGTIELLEEGLLD